MTATTIADLLLARADDDRVALLAGDTRLRWSQVVAGARARAALLASMPPADPPHVGVLLEATPEFVCWIWAAALARVTVVGVNPTRRGEALARDVRHTDCRYLVTDAAGAGLVTGLDLDIPDERRLVVDDPSYPRLLDEHADAGLPATTAEPSDRLVLTFTSGSTGAPKAVVCSTGRLTRIALSARERLGLRDDDVLYQSMPMFHGNAFMANIAPALALGAPVALRPRFSASAFLADVRRYGATYFNYVGRALAYVLATPERTDDADNPLRLGFGTEASSRDRAEFTRRFGCELVEKYGSSEGVIATHLPPRTPRDSIGLPLALPGSDVAVVDPETGAECSRAEFDEHGGLRNADDAIGELVDRGGAPGFEGYYRNATATAERLRGGWYWSGDLAYRDADGFLYFAGRGADWLRVDSENFAAGPVEAILARHPDVAVAAVYAVPDPRTGDQVMAALELLPGRAFDADGFAAFLLSQPDLGTKWAPRFVRVLPAMPLTATHKVDKRPLRRDRWEAAAEPVWWRPDREVRYRPFTAAARRTWQGQFSRHGRAHLLAATGGGRPDRGAPRVDTL